MAGPDGRKSACMALGGVLAAGSLVLLWLACAVPSGRLGLTAAAGLFPMAASLYAGRAAEVDRSLSEQCAQEGDK